MKRKKQNRVFFCIHSCINILKTVCVACNVLSLLFYKWFPHHVEQEVVLSPCVMVLLSQTLHLLDLTAGGADLPHPNNNNNNNDIPLRLSMNPNLHSDMTLNLNFNLGNNELKSYLHPEWASCWWWAPARPASEPEHRRRSAAGYERSIPAKHTQTSWAAS